MTRDVLISIKGLHNVNDTESSQAEEDDEVELISPGRYYFRNEKHYVEYEEPAEEDQMAIKSRITLQDHRLEVIRRGTLYSKMIFEENTKNESWYLTPAGGIFAGFDVSRMQISESDELIEILVDYALELNYEHVSDSRVQIRIMAKDSGLFHIV